MYRYSRTTSAAHVQLQATVWRRRLFALWYASKTQIFSVDPFIKKNGEYLGGKEETDERGDSCG